MWNFNQYSNIFIHENAFENVICEMASILFRPQFVKNILENPVDAQLDQWIRVTTP